MVPGGHVRIGDGGEIQYKAGNVFEGYATHRISKKFIVKLAYIHYDYEYSGSGWHLGAPKELDDTPVLGFPTYDEASKASLGFMARF